MKQKDWWVGPSGNRVYRRFVGGTPCDCVRILDMNGDPFFDCYFYDAKHQVWSRFGSFSTIQDFLGSASELKFQAIVNGGAR